jgi:hypothetical protein
MPDRKPLELVVWPKVDRWVKHPSGGGWREYGYETPTGVYDFTLFGPDLFDKRLTDAELAAEVHSAVLDIYRSKVHGTPTTEALDRMAAMLRFAVNDHYDQEDR